MTNFSVSIMSRSIIKTLGTSRLITKQANSIYKFCLGLCLHESGSSTNETFLFNRYCFVWLNFNGQVLCQNACCLFNVASMSSPLSSLINAHWHMFKRLKLHYISILPMIYNQFQNLAPLIWLDILKQP